jgi:hypothetical protein
MGLSIETDIILAFTGDTGHDQSYRVGAPAVRSSQANHLFFDRLSVNTVHS